MLITRDDAGTTFDHWKLKGSIMGYITNADIEQRLGSDAYVQLTDDDGDGEADVGVVDEARLAAEGEVDSYLARRYQVPINLALHPELSGLLKSITLDLVELRLRSRRPPVSDEARNRAQRTVDWLGSVAEGRTDLPSSSMPPSSTSHGTHATTSGETRVLSHDELSGY